MNLFTSGIRVLQPIGSCICKQNILIIVCVNLKKSYTDTVFRQ